jgi:S1-C subfamily serine protease
MSFRSVSPHVRDFFRFRWRMLLLFAAAVFFAGVSGVYFVRYLAKPNTGLVVNFPEAVSRDGMVVFAPKTPFSPAAAAGLLPYRDQILSVDGKAVRSLLT